MSSSPFTKYIQLTLCFTMLLGSSLACGSSTPDEPTPTEAQPTETLPVKNKPTTRPTTIPAKAATAPAAATEDTSGDTWTVMMYEDADDDILEEDTFMDVNEAERVGSTDKVKIVVQMDRYKKGFKGKQDWSTAKRFLLTKDNDLERIKSKELADLGEVNMADGATLVDFATWAIKNYPADHYVLILADHGAGWPGGWTEADMKENPKNVELDGFYDMIYLNELVDSLGKIRKNTGINKFEMIGFDACLMGDLEVFTAVAPYAKYAVASQETEPSMGWAYTSFLTELTRDPSMRGAELSSDIVKSYIAEDTLLTDDKARAKYLSEYYGSSDSLSEADLVKEETKTVTLTAVDLTQIDPLNTALNNLVQAMGGINQKMVARARTHTRAFESVFGDDYPSPYLDLGNFIKQIEKESTSPKVKTAGDAVAAALKKAVIAEKHGNSKKGSTGISIYFPNSKLFKEDFGDYEAYSRVASSFASVSLWDDFLTFHYTGQPIKANNTPAKREEIISPATGGITVDPISLSADTASVDKPVTLTTDVKGENVAYIYLFIGQVSEDGNSVRVVDIDYIDSDSTYTIDGNVYPDWGGSDIPIELDWEPTQYVVTAGEDYLPVLLQPDTYGAEMKDTTYTVDGLYTFANGDPDRYVRLFYSGEGNLMQVMGFSNPDGTGPMHEITPAEGDQVTFYDQVIPLDDSQTDAQQTEAGTLTFGKDAWAWEAADTDTGNYVIGVIAEDMDGNTYEEYAPLTVE